MQARVPAWELAARPEWLDIYSVTVAAYNGAKAEAAKQQQEQAKKQR